jgi:hypothetical protein
MIDIECPDCKTPIRTPDDRAGQSMPCPRCGIPLVVRMLNEAIASGEPAASTSTQTTIAPGEPSLAGRGQSKLDFDAPVPSIARDLPRTWLTIAVYAIVIFSIVTVLIALLVPATSRVREASPRTQSTNNLKNIGLAMHAFHDTHKRLPFNGSDDAAVDGFKYCKMALPNTTTSGSWAFQLLPHVDQGPMFIHAHRGESVATYLCPGRKRPGTDAAGGAWSDYFLNSYLNDPKQASKPDVRDMKRTLGGITDGSGNTVMVGHGNISTGQYDANANVAGSSNIFLGGMFGTMRGGDDGEKAPGGVMLKGDSAEAPTFRSWGGPWAQGALMVMCDGTVRMFPYTTQNFSSFLTPTGNEAVQMPD